MPKQYAQPLRLVTPPMRGQNVKDAQWLMRGNSRFEGLAPYKDGKVDGVYGPVAAAATKRAKFWLGFPLASCDQQFGQTLYEYLRPNEWRPLPPTFRDRRNQRLAEAAKGWGEQALEYALRFEGVSESPFGSNYQQFGKWYGWNGVPWCGIFLSYNFHHVGYTRFRYPYVPTLYSDIINGRNNLRRVWTPLPGDVACLIRNGHTAFFHSWANRAAGEFFDYGGNTGPTSISNGGRVMKQRRTLSQVTAFGRVG